LPQRLGGISFSKEFFPDKRFNVGDLFNAITQNLKGED